MPWMSHCNWDTVILPKEAGGLGIPSTRHRNCAILMNQAWRLYTSPNTLLAQVLKAKYFPHTTLFTKPACIQGSHIWKVFLIGIKYLMNRMSWIVGDGSTIRIWKDPWLPQGSLRSYIEGPLLYPDKDRKVSSLRTNHSWNFEAFDFPLPPSLLAPKSY